MWGQQPPAVRSSKGRLVSSLGRQAEASKLATSREGLTVAALASETLQATSLRYNYGHGNKAARV
jgi:hypothetical protein